MIELGLLGLLRDQDLHGYELRKQLSELLGSWSSLSFGSLYPALGRLERARQVKAVEAHVAPEPATPMTGALTGELAAFRHRLSGGLTAKGKPRGAGRRGKKVYGITDVGRDRLTELLLAPGPDDERSFGLRVAFCRHLSPAERVTMFERRRSELAGALTERRRSPGRRADPYLRSLRERDTRALSHDLAWLDELLGAARADLPSPPTAPRRTRGTIPTTGSPARAAPAKEGSA
jgi:DNA-binding PadR family transcriptional regulator